MPTTKKKIVIKTLSKKETRKELVVKTFTKKRVLWFPWDDEPNDAIRYDKVADKFWWTGTLHLETPMWEEFNWNNWMGGDVEGYTTVQIMEALVALAKATK